MLVFFSPDKREARNPLEIGERQFFFHLVSTLILYRLELSVPNDVSYIIFLLIYVICISKLLIILCIGTYLLFYLG